MSPYRPGSRRQGGRLALSLFLAMVASIAVDAGALGPNDRRLTNVRTGITVEAPGGWALSQHTGYGETIALMLHPDGSRISVTVAATEARDATTLLEQNRRGLAAQGLVTMRSSAGPRGSAIVDLSAQTRNESIRQMYLVRDVARGRQAVVLTLVCRAALLVTHGAALDFAAARMSLESPAIPLNAARADTQPVGAGGSAGEGRRPSRHDGPPAKELPKR